ncbi:MAG: ABC transporter substrate-binding protein [Enterobacteriaceae bacterium]
MCYELKYLHMNPPYVIIYDKTLEGASIDLSQAIGELLGVKIQHVVVPNFAGMLAGIQNGRYQLTIGPIGDFSSRQEKMDFIDFANDFGILAVRKSNPKRIQSLESTCGISLAVISGSSAERAAKKQSEHCIEQKKEAITVQTYPNIAASALAVRSQRADAMLHAIATLSWQISLADGELELAGMGHDNGFGRILQGSALPKDSPLTPILRDAYQELFDNGTYAAIMKKWHLEKNMLPAPGINLAKE